MNLYIHVWYSPRLNAQLWVIRQSVWDSGGLYEVVSRRCNIIQVAFSERNLLSCGRFFPIQHVQRSNLRQNPDLQLECGVPWKWRRKWPLLGLLTTTFNPQAMECLHLERPYFVLCSETKCSYTPYFLSHCTSVFVAKCRDDISRSIRDRSGQG